MRYLVALVMMAGCVPMTDHMACVRVDTDGVGDAVILASIDSEEAGRWGMFVGISADSDDNMGARIAAGRKANDGNSGVIISCGKRRDPHLDVDVVMFLRDLQMTVGVSATLPDISEYRGTLGLGYSF
jgi:hypothetical protein